MSLQHRRSSGRRRPHNERAIHIRIGSPADARRYTEVEVVGPQDGRLLARCIDERIRQGTKTPLILSINDHQPWLKDVLSVAVFDPVDQISDLNRELQFTTTSRLPEKATAGSWSFIIDQINVPEVFYWSVNTLAPKPDDFEPLDLTRFKLRVGVWFGGPGSCRLDSTISTILIFTKPHKIADHIVSELLFPALYKDGNIDGMREDDGICWVFSKLFWLCTDWQNIIRELNTRLAEAEINSHHRDYPVRYRTRAMHRDIARIHELKDYLRFHTRSLKKLQKLEDTLPTHARRRTMWNEMDDVVDDLAHFEESLDSLKERLNNLLGLEFNIQAADQSEGAAFLSIVATLFLPLSYLTSLWGISTSDWTTIWYVCAAVIVFAASVMFLVVYPWLSKKWQKRHYRLDQSRVLLRPQDLTMLGEDLPDNADTPGQLRPGIMRHRSQQLGGPQLFASRHRNSSRSARHGDDVKEV